MKNFAKFIPVALGMLTLASCSSDDLFGDKAQIDDAQSNGLTVKFEDMKEEGSVFTRSYLNANSTMASRRYVPADALKVYDNDLNKYDIYQFSWTAGMGESNGLFRRWNTESNITGPKWALYPKEDIIGGKWTYNEHTNLSHTTAYVMIPAFMTYDATYSPEDTKMVQPLYKDVLPRWGSVTATNGGDKLEANLNYMTGVLRFKLAGIDKYAKWILVKMFVGGVETNQVVMTSGLDMDPETNTDYFKPVVAHSNNPDPDAQIAFTETSNVSDEYTGIMIQTPQPKDLAKEAKTHGVLYVPLVTTGDKKVDIVVYASTNTAQPDYDYKDVASNWKEVRRFENKKIERAKLYGNKSEVNLAIDGTDADAINDALELAAPDNETIIVTATNENGIEICSDDATNIIQIPNKAGVKNVIIDLSNGLYSCGGGDGILTIQDKEKENPFTGNVMLIGAAKAGAQKITLDVQLPQAQTFGFAGNALAVGATDFSKIDAQGFQLGDGKTPTSSIWRRFHLSDNVKTISVAEGAELTTVTAVGPLAFDEYGKNVNAVIVNNGTIKCAIAAADKVVDVTVAGDDETETYIGAITGAITTKGTVTIKSDFDSFQAITADGDIAISGKAQVKGANDVTSKEGKVTLTEGARVEGKVTAKSDIAISNQAKVVGNITSEEGNITILSEFESEANWGGLVTATVGSVTLTQTGEKPCNYKNAIKAGEDVVVSGNVTIQKTIDAGQDVKLSGKVDAASATPAVVITAGRDFEVTEEAIAKVVNLKRTATVNISKNEGDARGVISTMKFAGGEDYTLNLLSGCVYEVDATEGEVALTFSDQPAYAAIAKVTHPENLKPTNKSIWNGKPLTVASAYFIANPTPDPAVKDGNQIWTASQLGMAPTVAAALPADGLTVNLCNDIDLNNEEWAGIEISKAAIIEGNYKRVYNVNIVGKPGVKYAGFISKAADDLTVNNLTLDGVQTNIEAISGGVFDGGIGGVIGQAAKNTTLSRVIVSLFGDKNFGSNGDDNLLTRNVGGLIGYNKGNATLTGVQVDANGAALAGYYALGGLIGNVRGNVEIKQADKTVKEPLVKVSVEDLKFNVTHDATNGDPLINDTKQGMTGYFIGTANISTPKRTITISDVTDVKPAIEQVAESKANEIAAFNYYDDGLGTKGLYRFMRADANADQTLIGQSGFQQENWDETDHGNDAIIMIGTSRYQVYQPDGGHAIKAGAKKLYSLNFFPMM